MKNFDTFNDNRRINLNMANALINKIFFKNTPEPKSSKEVGSFAENKDKNTAWKTKINMCKTYMFYQVLKAFIWKNVYANVNSMFDVSGENQEADNDSNKQKAMLVDILEKMKYPKTCDKIIDYSLFYGELISMVSWKKHKTQFRKLIESIDLAEGKLDALIQFEKGKKYFVDEKTDYDNPYIYAVNPADFVFDVAQKSDWDNCPKIYRTWKTPEDIINNKYYKVSSEVAEQLRNSVKTPESSDRSQMDKDLERERVNGSTVEVLEHWGNFTFDGQVLKNYHVVVAGGKHLIRFEPNKYIINPFTYDSFINDPETQRGISQLYCTLPLAELQEDLMNRTCDMQALSENPPIYAPKGFFEESEVKLYPGKIIEFGDELNPADIKQMEFAVSVFLSDITFLSDLQAEISGIFPNMAGADETRAKTATEISTKAQGQLTRLSMAVDTINQGLIVPDVEKVAKLCADFKSGEEQIFIVKGSEKETITINDSIRKQEYRYTYADRTATTERSNKADIVISACKEFAQFLPLNAPELFTWYMEQKDVENPERFMQLGETIPPEIQQLLLQNPQIKQLCDAYNAQQHGGQQPPIQPPVTTVQDAGIPQQTQAME